MSLKGQKRTSRPRCSRQQSGAVMRPGIGLVGTGLASRTAPCQGSTSFLVAAATVIGSPMQRPKAEGDRPAGHAIPDDVRKQSPWQGQHRGELANFNTQYLRDIEEQGYALVICEAAVFQPEGGWS